MSTKITIQVDVADAVRRGELAAGPVPVVIDSWEGWTDEELEALADVVAASRGVALRIAAAPTPEGLHAWATERVAIYASDDHRCCYCGADLATEIATLDHVLACELGGTNEATNLVTCCLSCNSSKRDLPLADFLSVLADRGVDSAAVKTTLKNASRRHARLERRGRK